MRQRRNLRHLLNFGLLIVLLTGTGCRSTPEPVVEPVPGWLESIPKDTRYYYAVGISGPTLRITDAWDQAIKRARAELGRLIVSHITSHDMIISTSRGEYVRELVNILSDAELNYTEVIERWADRSGIYGPPGHFYVLVRMEKKGAEEVLRGIKETALEKAGTIR